MYIDSLIQASLPERGFKHQRYSVGFSPIGMIIYFDNGDVIRFNYFGYLSEKRSHYRMTSFWTMVLRFRKLKQQFEDAQYAAKRAPEIYTELVKESVMDYSTASMKVLRKTRITDPVLQYYARHLEFLQKLNNNK